VNIKKIKVFHCRLKFLPYICFIKLIDMVETKNVTELVKNYDGGNRFILSLKNGLTRYGRLTPKQLAAANKFFGENEPKKEFTPKDVNVNIKVKRFMAKQIAEDNDLEFKPFLLTVTKVVGESAKALKVVGRMTTSDVTSCRCCGADLTDWRSQATGVGPICVKSLDIPYVKDESDIETFKKILKMKIDKIGDLTFWLPKSQIKEGLDELLISIK
jgi:hypothetical protein